MVDEFLHDVRTEEKVWFQTQELKSIEKETENIKWFKNWYF